MPLDEKAVMLKLKVFPKNANVHAACAPRRKPVARRTSAAHHATRRTLAARARRATWWLPELRAVKAGARH